MRWIGGQTLRSCCSLYGSNVGRSCCLCGACQASASCGLPYPQCCRLEDRERSERYGEADAHERAPRRSLCQHAVAIPTVRRPSILRFPLSQPGPAVVVMNCNFRTNCLLKLLLQHKFFPKPDNQGLLKIFNRTHERSLRFWASAVTHFILKQLFEFSPLVRSHGLAILNKTVLPRDFGAKETTECLICIHVRSGKNTGEGDRHHNIADFGECAYMVEKGIAKANTCPRNPYWVVISDHPDAPSIVGGNFSTPLSTNSVGPIVHVDRIGVGAAHRSGAMRLYVDFFVLSRCKHFVASMSTLGETASMLHGPSVHRFDMDHSGMCSSTPSNIHDWQRDVHISKAEWLKSLEH